MDSKGLWEGFIAAMIHDIAKLVEFSGLINKGQVSHKEITRYLDAIRQKYFLKPLNIPSSVYDLIRKHHDYPEGIEGSALSLADKISKTIQGYRPTLEDDERLKSLRSQEPHRFFPFYGYPLDWSPDDCLTKFRKIYELLAEEITVKNLLTVQKYMVSFPHTSYVPHISLAVHHQFTAAIYYFLYQKIKDLSSLDQLKDFCFSVIEIRPNFMDLFYRLRDVIICQKLTERLYTTVYKEIYAHLGKDLVKIGPWSNPFVFYCKQGIVCLHDNYSYFKERLSRSFELIEGIRSIEILHTDFYLTMDTEGSIDKRPSLAKIDLGRDSMLSKRLFSLDQSSFVSCELCNKPLSKDMLKLDDKGNLVCEICSGLRTISSGIDIDKISEAESGEKRIAYVIITFPDNLPEHAKEVAEISLIPSFFERVRLSPGLLGATETGLYEYLQALLELESFDKTLEDEIVKITNRKGELSAVSLFIFPTLKIFLLREDKVWEFWGIINSERPKMKLEMSVKVVICDAKTPFWSIIEESFRHLPHDRFIDLSKEVVIVFNSEEVRNIRKIADLAKRNRVWPTQIHNVSQVALRTTLDELILEIDIRRDRLRGIEEELKKSLQNLTIADKEYLNREKRTVFLKYIANLSKMGGK